jgi:hypothetical protein
MSEFRTIVSPTSAHAKVSMNHRIYTIGSCFSDTIGKNLAMCKFHTLANPFGVIYNPESIHSLLDHSILDSGPNSEAFVQSQDRCHHYDFHSALSGPDRSSAEHTIREKISEAHRFLKAADWLFITYGTAWVYELSESKKIVANCHKMPASLFTKRLLPVEEIITSFRNLFATLKRVNPKLRVLVTVSPVRHIKDTIPLNQVSKSTLRVACHAIASEFADVEYFPSYEIMMDDLRDYRFYKEDMLHPTEQAENYIWKNFIDSYFDETAIKFVNQWKSIQTSMSHRAFHSQSDGHQNFLKQTIRKLENLQATVDVSAEIATLKSQLNS